VAGLINSDTFVPIFYPNIETEGVALFFYGKGEYACFNIITTGDKNLNGQL
jgi:hypothetical protein